MTWLSGVERPATHPSFPTYPRSVFIDSISRENISFCVTMNGSCVWGEKCRGRWGESQPWPLTMPNKGSGDAHVATDNDSIIEAKVLHDAVLIATSPVRHVTQRCHFLFNSRTTAVVTK